MRHVFDVPEKKKLRLIIDSDAKNEADDQYAIVHALLSPRFFVKGIIGSQFKNSKSVRFKLVSDNTVDLSCNEIHKILQLMDMEGEIPVFRGGEASMIDQKTLQNSEGADFIIQEAKKCDSTPLYVIFLGSLTDLASAYLKDPSIVGKFTAVWIGGGEYPEGGWEANLNRDIHAANVVFGSELPLWQIPLNTYRTMRVGISELALKVKPCDKIGDYLYQQLVDFNERMGFFPEWPKGESWCLGDSPAVGVLIDEQEGCSSLMEAPVVTPECLYVKGNSKRKIRVYHSVDARYILEDFFAKLTLRYGNKNESR